MSKDLNRRSSELICWLTADWVTPLICAALVKLSVSARSQKTFRLSICIWKIEYANKTAQSTDVGHECVSTCFTFTSNSWLVNGFCRYIESSVRPVGGT